MNSAEPDRDALFVEIAMNLGYLTSEQAEACRDDQRHFENMGYSRSMMQIAREKEFVDQKMVVEIRREMQRRGVMPRIGGYELLEKIGQGGMGTVYKARQVSLDRIVALKVLPPELARDKSYVARFKREGMIAARIVHPNAVQVIDVGESGGRHFMVMEYVEGFSADRPLKQGPMPEDQALEIIRGVLAALDVAHQANIIHRDIKPANILIDKQGRPKLADLGIARQSGMHGGTLTGTGTPIGTPHYMSPEQCQGESDLDARADIYSLGATLYHLCCGEPPYAEIHPMAVMHHQMHEPVPDPRDKNPEISESVAALILKMMSKDRNDRPADCAAVLDEIEKVARGETPKVGGGKKQARVSVTAPPTPTGATASTPVATPAPAAEATRLPKKWKIGLGIATPVFAAIILALILAGGQETRPIPTTQQDLLAAYEDSWSRAEDLDQEGRLDEALIELGRLSNLGERMETAPESFAMLEDWTRDLRRRIRADHSSEAAMDESEIPDDHPEPSDPSVEPPVETVDPPIYTQWPFDENEARRRQRETAEALGMPIEKEIDLGEGVSITFVLIPAGEFIMGSPEDEKERGSNEGPQHRVRISKPFYIGKYEVTREQWLRLMEQAPNRFSEDARLPVTPLSWSDTQEYIRRLDELEKGRFRLPTEAEWEYACRAGTTTPFNFGETVSTDQANYDGNFAYAGGRSGEYRERPMPVGSFAANAWGLYDMHGNVAEWCGGGLREYTTESVIDPISSSGIGGQSSGPMMSRGPMGALRALRGGSWNREPYRLRSAYRDSAPPIRPFIGTGFRLVYFPPR